MPVTHRIFVYGTLKPGGYYHQQICTRFDVEAIPATAKGKLYHLSQLGYPAVMTGEDQVKGYILQFSNDELLTELDQLEGYVENRPPAENEYQREQVPVYDESGNPLPPTEWYRMESDRIQRYGGIYMPDGTWPHLRGLFHQVDDPL